MVNVLIVGKNPSARSPNKKIFKNSTLDRLHKWMDFCGIINFSFINTYDTIEESEVDLGRLQEASIGYDKVVALGGFVSTCLKEAKINHLEMPHPSPLNRQLNSKEYELLKLFKMKTYIHGKHQDYQDWDKCLKDLKAA